MAQQQSQQATHNENLPHAGEKYRCEQCGMEVEVIQDCQCADGEPRLERCGQPLTKE
jgi:hypothetical protein